MEPVAAAPVNAAPVAAESAIASGGQGRDVPAKVVVDPVPPPYIQDGIIIVPRPDGTITRVPVPELYDENNPEPDTAFFTYAGAFGVDGGRTGLQSATTQDKLGVHEDVMRDYANLRPAFDAIYRDGENRLAYYRENEGAPCEGGYWRVLVEKVTAIEGGGWEIQVSAGRSCQPGGIVWIDGGMSEVWVVAPNSTTPQLKSRAVTGASFGVG